MQDKVQIIKDKLALNFKGAKVRSLGQTIRMNVNELKDGPLIALGVISVTDCCDIVIKRSGTGLVIIITV